LIRTDVVEEARGVDPDSLEVSAAAQLPQNFAVGGFSYPHFAQSFLKGAAHSLQSFCSAGFSAPHVGQFTSGTQLIEQRLGTLQIRGVEALGEPVVDLGEHGTRLVATALCSEQLGETLRGTKFLPFSTPTARNFDRPFKTLLSFPNVGAILLKQQLALNLIGLGLAYSLFRLLY